MRAKTSGASRVWEKSAGGSITSGQANIASPADGRDQQGDGRTRRHAEHGPVAARRGRRRSRRRSTRQGRRDLVDREPAVRVEHLGDLGREGRRRARRRRRWGRRPRSRRRPARPPGRPCRATNSTSWVATTTARPSAASSRSSAVSRSLAPWSRPRVGSSSSTTPRRRGRAAPRARGRAAALRRGRGGAGRRRGRARAGRAARGRCPPGAPDSRSAWAHSSSTVARYSRSAASAARGRPSRRPSSATLGSARRPSPMPPWRRPAGWSAHSSDDFPEPLRPISATTSPAAQVEVDPAQRDARRRSARRARAPSSATVGPRGGRGRRAAARRRRGASRSGPARRRASRTDSGSGSQPARRPSRTTGGASVGRRPAPAAGVVCVAAAVAVEEHDAVGVLHHPLEAVLGHHDGDAEVVHEPGDGGEHLLGGGGVERGRRLVEHEDARVRR